MKVLPRTTRPESERDAIQWNATNYRHFFSSIFGQLDSPFTSLAGLSFGGTEMTHIILFLIACLSSSGASLLWDVSPDAAGYCIYAGNKSGDYTEMTDVGASLSYLIPAAQGNFYFVVTAYDVSGLQSLPSAEIQYLPLLLTLVGVNTDHSIDLNVSLDPGYYARIWYSSDLQTWQLLAYIFTNALVRDYSAAFVPSRFYRADALLISSLP